MSGGTGGRGARPRGLVHVGALDGLRGVAVAGVLLFHGGVAWAGGGFLGVSTFFTLSGFLITSLLVLERESTGRIDLARFWTRRMRRLLPAALIALAGIAIFGIAVADAHQAARLPADGLSALAYVANWRFVLGDQSYAALFSAPSPVQHFWSLAIEEQFYLCFPLLAAGLLALAHGSRRTFGLALAGLAVASGLLAAVLYAPGQDPSRVYYGTDTRAVELLVGALLAVLVVGRPRPRALRGQAIALAGTAALAALLVAWLLVDQRDALLYRGGLPLHAALTALVILAAMQPGSVQAVLSIAPLRGLGLVSYGVYLYHWPIFLWLSPARTGLDGAVLFGLRIAIVVAIAVLSYRFVEQPIRAGRRVTGWRPAALAPLAAGTVAVALLALPGGSNTPELVFEAVHRPQATLRVATPAGAATLPVTGPDSSPLTAAPPTAAPPTAAPPVAPVRRIMVVGDSVAQTVGRGLERWGPPHGVEVLNAAKKWCAIARGGRLGGQWGHRAAPACDGWASQWPPMLDDFRPDVVVVLTTVWDVGSRQRDEWGPEFRNEGDPAFDEWVRSEWSAAAELLRSHGARVVWLTIPCMANTNVTRLFRFANRRYVPEVARRTGATTVDLDRHVCPGRAFTDRPGGIPDARPDGLHFSDPGADWLASWLGPRLADPNLRSDLEPAHRVLRS